MPTFPFEKKNLPAPIQQAVKEFIKGSEGDVVDVIEDYLHEGGERTSDVLAALAYFKFYYAINLMVDEVLEHGEAALAYIEEALFQSSQPERLLQFKQKVEKAVKREKRRQRQVEKLNELPEEQLTLEQMSELAFMLHSSKKADQLLKSYRLYMRLYKERPPSPKDPGIKFYEYSMAALALADAKHWDEALPMFKEIFQSPQRKYYEHFIAYAYYRLLELAYEQRNKEEFIRLWQEANTELKSLNSPEDYHFPYAIPSQDKFLKIAHEWRLTAICTQLLTIYKEYRTTRNIPQQIKQLLTDIEQKVVMNNHSE